MILLLSSPGLGIGPLIPGVLRAVLLTDPRRDVVTEISPKAELEDPPQPLD